MFSTYAFVYAESTKNWIQSTPVPFSYQPITTTVRFKTILEQGFQKDVAEEPFNFGFSIFFKRRRRFSSYYGDFNHYGEKRVERCLTDEFFDDIDGARALLDDSEKICSHNFNSDSDGNLIFPDIFFERQQENDFCRGGYSFSITQRDFPKKSNGRISGKDKRDNEPDLEPVLEKIMKILGVRRKLSAALTFMLNSSPKSEKRDRVSKGEKIISKNLLITCSKKRCLFSPSNYTVP